VRFSIISIGTELNLGLITNTNAQFIAETLTNIGLECNYIISVRDNENDIINSLKICSKFSEILVICGGLGPTDDDLTRNAVSKYLKVKLVKIDSLDKTSLKFLSHIKNDNLTEKLKRQSYIPEGSIPIIPRIGSASGFIIQSNNNLIFSIPGVPREMKDMLEGDVVPYLNNFLKEKGKSLKKQVIKKSVLMATDISESQLEFSMKSIKPLAKKLNVELGITASPGLIKIILISKASSLTECSKNLERLKKEITGMLGEYIYLDKEGLIGDSLKEAISNCNYKVTISAAESITGGLISSLITDTPGSSDYFLGSIISYSNYAKEKLLRIDKNLIIKNGTVSAVVAAQMAKNCKEIFQSDFSVSATGFAGPTVNEEGKFVGLVYACINYPNGNSEVYEKNFIGTRTDIKFRTAQFVINKLRLNILKFGVGSKQ